MFFECLPGRWTASLAGTVLLCVAGVVTAVDSGRGFATLPVRTMRVSASALRLGVFNGADLAPVGPP